MAIRSIRLDAYLKDKDVDRVDLLKIDIEGYELTALQGAELSLNGRLIKAIYFETASAGDDRLARHSERESGSPLKTCSPS